MNLPKTLLFLSVWVNKQNEPIFKRIKENKVYEPHWEFKKAGTLQARFNDEIVVSVSKTGECRFYDGHFVPGLEECALSEAKSRIHSIAITKTELKPPLHNVHLLQGYAGKSRQYEIISHSPTKKQMVESTRKYGTPKLTGIKYDKKAIPLKIVGNGESAQVVCAAADSTTSRVQQPRCRNKGASGTMIQYASTQPVESEVVVRTCYTTKPTARPRKTKRGGKLISRDVLARMQHNPCRVIVG